VKLMAKSRKSDEPGQNTLSARSHSKTSLDISPASKTQSCRAPDHFDNP
jgi:hypothetical protein